MYNVGQKVEVSFKGVVSGILDSGVGFYIRPDGVHRSLYVAKSVAEKLTIEIAEPANWPPRYGDVWEAEGKLYAALANSSSMTLTLMSNAWVNYHASPGVGMKSFGDFKSLNPVLKYREGE